MTTRDEKIFRIIDANFNRSREGLRVCEEIARFILNSKPLTEDLKSARHKISTIRKNMGAKAGLLMTSRDVEGDVTKNSLISARTRRTSLADIYQANMQRVKESVRVLEEFFKLIDETTSRKLQSLRFDIYEIEQKSARPIAGLNK
jgi:thiamine-phosphate pyrophosphorylase